MIGCDVDGLFVEMQDQAIVHEAYDECTTGFRRAAAFEALLESRVHLRLAAVQGAATKFTKTVFV